MRNQDVVFIANAKAVDVTKFLTYLNVILNTANNGLIVGQNGIALYNAAKALH